MFINCTYIMYTIIFIFYVWSVYFKILGCITLILNCGANTFIFYTKLNELPQYNYNSIHTLYDGLEIMLSSHYNTFTIY